MTERQTQNLSLSLLINPYWSVRFWCHIRQIWPHNKLMKSNMIRAFHPYSPTSFLSAPTLMCLCQHLVSTERKQSTCFFSLPSEKLWIWQKLSVSMCSAFICVPLCFSCFSLLDFTLCWFGYSRCAAALCVCYCVFVHVCASGCLSENPSQNALQSLPSPWLEDSSVGPLVKKVIGRWMDN